MPILTCKNVSVGYDGKTVASGLTFSVEQGDYLCIVGENGSGKSTLMKTLLGLLPATDGEIQRGAGMAPGDIGYLPQQTAVQRDFPASVWEIVLSGCQAHCGLRPYYTAEEKKLAKAAMKKMHIEPLMRRCYRTLSGGQQQRVLLSRALCAAKQVLLLDEPTAGLDPAVTEELYELIETLNRKDGMTIIMVSHDMSASLIYASHILHLGQHAFFGTKKEYQKHQDSSVLLKKEGDDE